MRIEDSHLVGGQCSQFGKPGKFKWVQAQVHASGNGDVHISALECGTRCDHREQAGGACCVHCVTCAFEIEVIADSPGDGVGEASSQRFFSCRWKRCLVESFDFFNQFLQI